MIAVTMPSSSSSSQHTPDTTPQSSPSPSRPVHCLVFMRSQFGDKPGDQLLRAQEWCLRELGATELIATRIYFHAHFATLEACQVALTQSQTTKSIHRPPGSRCLQRNCGHERHSVSGRIKKAGLDYTNVRRWILAQKRVALYDEVFRDVANAKPSNRDSVVLPTIPDSIKQSINEKQKEMGFAALPMTEQSQAIQRFDDAKSQPSSRSPSISQALPSSPMPSQPRSSQSQPQSQPSSPAQPKKGLKVYVKSRAGSSWDPQKVNQDRPLACVPLRGHAGVNVYGVLDGHGVHGHYVSEYVMHQLPPHLAAQPSSLLHTDTHQAILNAVKQTVQELKTSSNINLAFSGSTLCFGLHINDTLYVANVGDSRAIIGRRSDSGHYSPIPLSRDHKPDTPGEMERILAAGGRVMPIPGLDSGGPNRVWLAELDEPGLAMSRSIGDEVSASVGVIDVPEIMTHTLTSSDTFALFASDGVWEFLSDQQCVSIIAKHLENPAVAVNSLVGEAVKRWQEDSDTVIDDITVVLVFFADRN